MFSPFFEARLATLSIVTALVMMGGSSSSAGQTPRPTPTPNPSPTPTPTPTPGPVSITLAPFVSALQSPVDLQTANDGSGRMFVVEQGGRFQQLQPAAFAVDPTAGSP